MTLTFHIALIDGKWTVNDKQYPDMNPHERFMFFSCVPDRYLTDSLRDASNGFLRKNKENINYKFKERN